MKKTCAICFKEFDSEGHSLGDWLTICSKCNNKYTSYKERNEMVNLRLKGGAK